MANSSASQKRSVWEKTKVLGKGAFGEVSLWREVHTQQLIAVKECIRLLDTDADFWNKKHIEYWKKEVETMYKLKHPNIVQAVVLPDELLEKLNRQLSPLGMEYINGGSLRALMDRPENWWLPEQKVRHILHDTCSALQYLHGKNIVHRDIKPENIVIQLTGNDRNVYKIIDLGYIKELHPDSVTQSLVGTKPYIAPEMVQSQRKYNYLIDYWSLGIVAFEITTGVRPFAAVSWPEIHQLTPELMQRNDGIIFLTRTPKGIMYSRDLPDRPIQKRFKNDLTVWLRTVLSFNPEKRNPDPKFSSLESMLAVLNTKVVQIFDTTTQNVVVIPEDASPEKLHIETLIPPSNQLLISSDGKEITFAQLMERACPYVVCDTITAYVFSFNNNYILSPNGLPTSVEQKLANHKLKRTSDKRLWQEMYHYVDGEYTNCCNTLAAYRKLIVYLNSLHSELTLNLDSLSASYEEVKISSKILKDNQDYDRIQMSEYPHAMLKELWELLAADVAQNVAAIKNSMRTIKARSHTLHDQLARLSENPFSCSDPPTNLESLRNEVLVTLKEFKDTTRPNEDMETAVQNFEEEYDRLLGEIRESFCAGLSQVKEIREAVAQAQTFGAEVAREQCRVQTMLQKRRVAVWNVIKRLMIRGSQDEPMGETTDSLTREHNVGRIIKDNEDNRIQLDILNTQMELELSRMGLNVASFASFIEVSDPLLSSFLR